MAEATQANIDHLARQVSQLNQNISYVNDNVIAVSREVEEANRRIEQLAADFERMMKEQARRAAVQQATTELVRVRQEIEQNFGNYKIVRDSMLGVLQATDSALVRKTTIANVSEELMLTTPRYWLAPCLVAVSAWISNDQDLAQRAISEAMRRDEEKTALVMALICRRNNRTDTCYEWLSIYFSKQNGNNFSESGFAYIDAYVNGIFGPDKKHICDDYINKWMVEVRAGNTEFENTLENAWINYYETFNVGTRQKYPNLSELAAEFPLIDAYIGRLNSLDNIYDNFDGIVNAEVDQEILKQKIDKNLIDLISKYDDEEMTLRNEERYHNAVKMCNGDVEKAAEAVRLMDEKNIQHKLNLVEQMMNCLSKSDTVISQKRTAVSFLKPYLKKGFESYVSEKRSAFPEYITLSMDGWTGMTYDGSNSNELYSTYEQHMEGLKAQRLNQIDYAKPKKKAITAGVFAVLAVVLFFAIGPVGLASLILTAIFGLQIPSAKKAVQSEQDKVLKEYADKITNGKDKIYQTLCEWSDAKTCVYNFDVNPARDIIA